MVAYRITPRSLRFAVTGVMAAVSLAGCASTGRVAKVEGAASQAQAALAQGKTGRAVGFAETAVEADPRAADKRALLGNAYLKSGRFDSAAVAFNDAMTLGDNSTRTALTLALAKIGAGRNLEAVALLDDWRDSIPASDLGLALALAGESARGVAILADAIRSGDNTAKTRQNLAYAYALDGRWREARLMVMQDVPADQVDLRLGTWASTIQPEAGHLRVAALLDVPVASDPGLPARLALANSPSAEQLAVETAATRPDVPVLAELPATAAVVEPTLAVALANPGPVASWSAPDPEAAAPSMISQPVIQQVSQPVSARPVVAARRCGTGGWYASRPARFVLEPAGRPPCMGHLRFAQSPAQDLPHDDHVGGGAGQEFLARCCGWHECRRSERVVLVGQEPWRGLLRLCRDDHSARCHAGGSGRPDSWPGARPPLSFSLSPLKSPGPQDRGFFSCSVSAARPSADRSAALE